MLHLTLKPIHRMKKYSILLLSILFVLLGLASYFLITKKNTKSSVDSSDRNFAVSNIDEITKVFIAKRGTEPNLLEKKSDGWYVNNKYKVGKNQIDNLINTIKNIRMASIPPKSAYTSIMKEMATIGTKVEIYTGGDVPAKTYYIGGVTNDERAVYFLMDKSVQPYIVELPQSVSNLTFRYELSEEDWRDKKIFSVYDEDLSTIQIDYPYEPNQSIHFQKKNKQWFAFDGQEAPITNFDQKILLRLVNSLQEMKCEAFENGNVLKSKIEQMTPYSTFSYADIHNQTYWVKIFPINPDIESKIDISPEFVHSDKLFRFYVLRQDGDLLLAQVQQMPTLLSKKSDFMK